MKLCAKFRLSSWFWVLLLSCGMSMSANATPQEDALRKNILEFEHDITRIENMLKRLGNVGGILLFASTEMSALISSAQDQRRAIEELLLEVESSRNHPPQPSRFQSLSRENITLEVGPRWSMSRARLRNHCPHTLIRKIYEIENTKTCMAASVAYGLAAAALAPRDIFLFSTELFYPTANKEGKWNPPVIDRTRRIRKINRPLIESFLRNQRAFLGFLQIWLGESK